MRGISALFAGRLLPVSGRLADLLNVEFILGKLCLMVLALMPAASYGRLDDVGMPMVTCSHDAKHVYSKLSLTGVDSIRLNTIELGVTFRPWSLPEWTTQTHSGQQPGSTV